MTEDIDFGKDSTIVLSAVKRGSVEIYAGGEVRLIIAPSAFVAVRVLSVGFKIEYEFFDEQSN